MVIRFLIVVLIIVLLGFSCNRNHDIVTEVPRPEKLLSKKEMISVMIDFRLTEGAIRHMISSGNNPSFVTLHFYKHALDQNKITMEVFEQNMRYYAAKPEEIDEIYSAVVDSLALLQSKAIAQ